MDEFTMQIVCAIAMFLTTAIAGFAPFKVSLNEEKELMKIHIIYL